MKRFNLGIYNIFAIMVFHQRKSIQVKPINQISTTVLNKVYKILLFFFCNFLYRIPIIYAKDATHFINKTLYFTFKTLPELPLHSSSNFH